MLRPFYLLYLPHVEYPPRDRRWPALPCELPKKGARRRLFHSSSRIVWKAMELFPARHDQFSVPKVVGTFCEALSSKLVFASQRYVPPFAFTPTASPWFAPQVGMPVPQV